MKRFAIHYEGQATEHPFGPFMLYKDHEACVSELEALLRRARAVIPDEYEDEIEVRAAINRYFNSTCGEQSEPFNPPLGA